MVGHCRAALLRPGESALLAFERMRSWPASAASRCLGSAHSYQVKICLGAGPFDDVGRLREGRRAVTMVGGNLLSWTAGCPRLKRYGD